MHHRRLFIDMPEEHRVYALEIRKQLEQNGDYWKWQPVADHVNAAFKTNYDKNVVKMRVESLVVC